MIDKILIPLDGSKTSEEVVPFATALANRLGAHPVFLNVVDMSEFASARGVMHGLLVDDLVEHAKELADGYLDKVRARVKEQGVIGGLRVAVGSPAQTIVDQASATNAGMIAMATHGRTGPARWALGSVTEGVLKASHTPLLVYRATGEDVPQAISSLLLPLDWSDASEQAVPLATFFAKALGVPLTIARVVPTTPVAFAEEDGAEMAEVLEAIENEARQYLSSKSQELAAEGLDVKTKFLRGDPAGGLIDLTHKLPECMVVMSTAGRTGIGRMVLGSVADRVVRHSHRPVVLVRAAG
jgi:nucleotide-binding universal stress UspA family protein